VWLNKLKNFPSIYTTSVPLWLKTVIAKMLTFNEDLRPSAGELEHFFEY
jgi:hypothetical protein